MAGFYTGTDLADKTFYGFRQDAATGNLTVEIINDGSPVVLPQYNMLSANDYRQWVWSRDTLQFQWGPSGHLQVRFV